MRKKELTPEEKKRPFGIGRTERGLQEESREDA